MNLFHSKTRGAPVLVRLCLLLSLLPGGTRAADSLWLNSGTIITPPQVDATNFVNTGDINIFSTLPFETSDTLNFTNSGTMVSTPGWFFDDSAPDLGRRKSAQNFVNLNGGTIQSIDGGGFIVIGGTGGTQGGGSSFPSYLFVDATNVVNKGTLSVGGNGWLKIVGTNVNTSRGALEVTALQPRGSVIINQTNYLNDVGISDIWWGQTNGFTFDSANVWNGTTATAPPHNVQRGPGGGFGPVSFSINNPFLFGYTNVLGGANLTLTNSDGSTTNLFLATNIIKQAVFVSVADPTLMTVDATFFPSTTVTNPFRTVSVQLALESTNVITQQLEATTLYFYDTLASETNRGLSVNASSTALPPFVFERPANYDLSRIDDGRFAFGQTGNAIPDPLFLYDPATFTNQFVTGEYAGYAAQIDNLATEPPPTTPGGVTNFPGRVQVYADTLDLRNTRIRGEGEVIVKANHLVSSAGAAVDVENLSYTLGETNGNLHIQNLAKQSVIRLKGQLLAWSALWSNTFTVVITNNFTVTNSVDTNGVITGTNAVQSPITNIVGVTLHALILDGDALLTRVPVTTWDLIIHSTNIVIDDSLSVVEALLLDGQSFTINGTLNLTSKTLQNNFGLGVTTELLNFVNTNAPTLLYLTNNGTFTIPSEAHFGDDRTKPYSAFVNNGTLIGGSVDVASLFVQNSGILTASVGPLDLSGGMGVFQNGQSSSGGDINYDFASIKFNNQQVSSVGALNFYVTNGLSDAGAQSGNSFRVENGFNLFIKPVGGDLLGTKILDTPPDFVEVNHVWAGADRGATAVGFSDNTALGVLTLTARSTSPNLAPLFFFTGATGHNGLYVDLLDLTSLGTNIQDLLQIDPSLTIYYAAVKVGFVPPPNAAGIPQEPEEYLNGQLGGHLVWVSSFAGPNSSVDVVINGVTVSVNSALRFSKIIDSNGNGVPNFYDPFPFNSNPLVLSAARTPQATLGAISVSWKASPQKSYQVEYASDVLSPNWQVLTQYTHTSSTSSTVTIWDTNAPAGQRRFYRVKTTQ